MWFRKDPDEPPSSDLQDPVPRRTLPPQLQRLVDHDDGFYDDVYAPYSVNSTETPYRYAAYATRIRTLLLSAHRYVAYTSEIGESFRPVAHPVLVRAAYAVSWTYLIGDVGHEGYKAYLRNRRALAPAGDAYRDATHGQEEHSDAGAAAAAQFEVLKGMATGALTPSTSASGGSQPSEYQSGPLTPWSTTDTPAIPLAEDYRAVMAERAVFQSLASMGLPALTIHSVVKYSGRLLKGSKNVFFRTWGPIGLGLSIVPLLPTLFDEPVEHAVSWSFRQALESYFGPDAVRPLPDGAGAAATDESTSLARFLGRSGGGQDWESATAGAGADAKEMARSWDEYRDQKRRAREERRRARSGEAQGEGEGKSAWGALKGVFGGGGGGEDGKKNN